MRTEVQLHYNIASQRECCKRGQKWWRSGRLGSGEDDFWQLRNGLGTWDGKSVAQIVPKCDFELGAGLGEAEEGVAAVPAEITARAAAELSPGDVAADVVFRSVSVQGDFGSIEHHQQFGLVGVEPREQAVESDETGLACEDVVEPRPQHSLALFGRGATIGLEISVELPDQLADGGLSGAVVAGEGVEFVNQSLGMNPAQAV